MDPIYARAIGVDTDELLVSQPDYGEQALQIADGLIASAAVDVVAIDSVAALTPRAELEGQIGDTDRRPAGAADVAGDAQAGRQPQPHQHGLRLHQPDPRKGRRPVRLAGDAAGRPGAEVLLPRSGSTSAASRPSRKAPRRSATGSGSRSSRTRCAAPFRQAEFDIEYGQGISSEGELLDFGIEHDLVRKSGAFFSYGETRLGQGRNNAKQFLPRTPRSPARSRPRSGPRSASAARSGCQPSRRGRGSAGGGGAGGLTQRLRSVR